MKAKGLGNFIYRSVYYGLAKLLSLVFSPTLLLAASTIKENRKPIFCRTGDLYTGERQGSGAFPAME